MLTLVLESCVNRTCFAGENHALGQRYRASFWGSKICRDLGFQNKIGLGFGMKVRTGCGMPKITIGMTGLSER